jgi:hypothetical protein
MIKYVAIAGWVLVVVLAISLLLQKDDMRILKERASSVHSACTEMRRLTIEGQASYAVWLTKGLRSLRSGDLDLGYKALDALLLTLVRSYESSGSEHATSRLEDPREYLEAVGDPWQR